MRTDIRTDGQTNERDDSKSRFSQRRTIMSKNKHWDKIHGFYLKKSVHIGPCIECFFSCLTDKNRPDALIVFIRLPKCYYHCDRLSSSLHRMLNFPETRRKTQRWQSFGRRVWPAFIGQAGKRNTAY
jgi:hypothetical protein